MERLNHKKGVSPVIATILLVALVIVIGAIIFIWFQSLTEEAVTKFDGQNVEIVCKDVKLEASYNNGQISIVNRGNVPIYSMKIKLEGSAGQSETINATSKSGWKKVGLNQGEAATLNIQGNYKQATLIPVLMGTTKEGERKTKSCPERHGNTVIM
ncbi:MAG: archaellin/type IV pilin N-terminal domain-containing protein [Candidatus Pacearchaeota archaeon]